MKQILVIVLLTFSGSLPAQNPGKTKKELITYLKENMSFSKGSSPMGQRVLPNTVKELNVTGTIMNVVLFSTSDKNSFGFEITNCYSFDLSKIEYSAAIENMDYIALKAINDDTSIYKTQICNKIDGKKGTDKFSLLVFYESYFMLPAKNKEKVAEAFNQLVAICVSESKMN